MVFFGAALILVAIAAAYAERRYHPLDRLVGWATFSDEAGKRADEEAGYRDDFGLGTKAKPCPKQDAGTMVAVILGQSNAANYAPVRTSANSGRVSVFYKGACYEARDPLLGATGNRGSIWPSFADAVIKSGRYSDIVLVPAAVGGTIAESWAPGGILWDRVESRLTGLAESNLRPTHFFIIQGETDADWGTSRKSYEDSATRMLKAFRKTGAEVFFATASQCNYPQNMEIRQAQFGARRAAGALAGPDMDKVGPDHRVRGCHLDAWAQKMIAQEWARLIELRANGSIGAGR